MTRHKGSELTLSYKELEAKLLVRSLVPPVSLHFLDLLVQVRYHS